MFCPNCHLQLDDNANFCPNCGVNFSNLNIHSDEAGINYTSGRYNCPHCGQNDKTIKVSVYVESETVSGFTREWTSDSDGDSYLATVPYTRISDLARKLSLPEKPEHQPPSCFWWIAPFIITPWISALIGPLTKKIKVIILILLIVRLCLLLFILPTSGLDLQQSDNSFALILACLSTLFGVSQVILFYVGLNAESRERETYINTVEIPRWNRANFFWNHLYFCEYDGYVFLPEENIAVPADRMNEILYR